jgi:hypothetical protein
MTRTTVFALVLLLSGAVQAQEGMALVKAMSAPQLRLFMTMAIASAGTACKVTEALYKRAINGDDYYTVRCDRGSAYAVMIPRDDGAQILVMDCEIGLTAGSGYCLSSGPSSTASGFRWPGILVLARSTSICRPRARP